MNYLLSEPHQAYKCTQSASDHKAALQTVCQQVLSARKMRMMNEFLILKSTLEMILSIFSLCVFMSLENAVIVVTHVESMSNGSVRSELTEPVKRHL